MQRLYGLPIPPETKAHYETAKIVVLRFFKLTPFWSGICAIERSHNVKFWVIENVEMNQAYVHNRMCFEQWLRSCQ